MSDELLVVSDTELLVLQGEVASELLETIGTTELIEVAEQGPPGPPGPPGLSGTASPPMAFSYGDASPRLLFTTPSASLVLAVSVNITAPFNGAAPTLRIGTAGQPELLLAAHQLDLTVATEFEVNPNVFLNAAQQVFITLAPGAGAAQGAGWIVVEQIPTT